VEGTEEGAGRRRIKIKRKRTMGDGGSKRSKRCKF